MLVTGLFLGLFVVLAIRALRGAHRSLRARRRGEKRGPLTLQSILFRVVLVALFALFLAVMGLRWYSDRQNAKHDVFSSSEEALAQLRLAYRAQPTTGGDEETGDDGIPYIGGTGLWFDAATYRRIAALIDTYGREGTGGSGELLLSGRDAYPLRAIVPPPVYRRYRRTGSPSISNPSYGFPFDLLPERATLRRVVRQGSVLGRTLDRTEDRWVRYAFWRTGPDTAFYLEVWEHSGEDGAWWVSLVSWGWQAMTLYIFLAPFAGIAAWYLSRKITRPVARVAVASQILAHGDLPERIPEEGPAELATMARSFNRLADRLDEAEAAQKEFVASVNHELKTPLTSLQGYGELLSDGAVSAEDAGPVVLAETARLERLVGDLLEAGRLDSGEFAVRREVVSLDDVAAAVLRRFESTAERFGISLGVRHEPTGEASVLADGDRLVQVVSNLTENALRCTPSGGSVRIVVRPPVTIRVVDTGPGLAEEDLPHAFDRFYLYERCGKDRPVGTGLGLSIVKELTEAMGGTVRVESDAGVGTVFEVELRPSAGPPPQTEPARRRRPHESTGTGPRATIGRMTRGRQHTAGALAVLAALACALLGASAWLPAAASAAGSSDPTPAGPVTPAPPVLDDVMGRAGRRAPARAAHRPRRPARRPRDGRLRRRPGGGRRGVPRERRQQDDRAPRIGRADRQGRRSLAKIQNALDWWNDRSPDGSLELFLPAAVTYGAPQTVRTGYEPIRMDVKLGWKGRQVLSDAAWRWEAMGKLGFAHDAVDDQPYPETRYADWLRSRNGADWAFVVYVVDSLHDQDGMFRNRVVAYTADLFGPYCMLTYDNDGYTFANFDAVLAHEMGHVFGALDEYRPPAPGYPSTGNLRSGYLGVLNGNAESGGTTDLPCIMRGSNGMLNAFAGGDLCRWTVGQTGLRDSDADTRPDVVDTRPAFSTGLESTSETTGAVTLGGAVTERPRKRGRISTGVYFRHDLSIKVPHAAQYRVDGGVWQPLARDRRRVRRALRGLDADHRVADRRATTCSTSRRRPARRPAGPETCGPAPRRSRSSSPPTRRSPRPR